MSIELALPKQSPFKFAVGDHVVRVSNTYKSSFRIGMRGYIGACPTINKAGMTGYKVIYPLTGPDSKPVMISSIVPEEDMEKDVSGSLYGSYDDCLVGGRVNREVLDFWEYYSNDINMTTEFCEKMFKGVRKMNYEFTVSTWVRFLHDFKPDDKHFIPANSIGVIASRSCQCAPSEINLVYTVNVPGAGDSWGTVHQVPEKILSKYDRVAAGNPKIEDIRAYNIWNQNKSEKEISDMDEHLKKLFLNMSVRPSEILPRQDVSVFAAITPVKIVFNNPATVVFWKDGTKTVVKRQKGTPFNKYYGYLAALGKKLHGSTIKVERMIEQIGIEEKPAKKVRKKEG